MNKPEKDIWWCVECRSQDVEVAAVVNPNTDEIVSIEVQSTDDAYCNDCGAHVDVESGPGED